MSGWEGTQHYHFSHEKSMVEKKMWFASGHKLKPNWSLREHTCACQRSHVPVTDYITALWVNLRAHSLLCLLGSAVWRCDGYLYSHVAMMQQHHLFFPLFFNCAKGLSMSSYCLTISKHLNSWWVKKSQYLIFRNQVSFQNTSALCNVDIFQIKFSFKVSLY